MAAESREHSSAHEAEDFNHPVVRKLTAEEARIFLEALHAQFAEETSEGRLETGSAPKSATQIVRWLLSQDGEDAENTLELIRSALDRVDRSVREAPKQALWDAACALYCLAASHVLRLGMQLDGTSGTGRRMLEVPESSDLTVAGIIAVAMENGRAVLQVQLHTQSPIGVHELPAPMAGDCDPQAAKRAIFTTVVGMNLRSAPSDNQKSRDLSADEYGRLRVAVRDARRRQHVLAVVLRNAPHDTDLDKFAADLDLPILRLAPAEDAASKLVGGLKQHMHYFWELLGVVSATADTQSSEAPPDQEMQRGPKPMLPPRTLPIRIPEHREGIQKIGSGCDNPKRMLDVVFIHGLDGDSWKSWMTDANDTRTFWPYWIAETFKQAGVFSLGYAADSTKWKGEGIPIPARARQLVDLLALDGIGKRPLAIIAHSMGGLIAKQMLHIAEDPSSKPEYQGIARQAKSIVFISTPHFGASLANLMQLLRIVTRPNEHLGELKAHDATLQQLHHWFLGFQRRSQLLCSTYYEQREVQLRWSPLTFFKRGILVVDPASADTNIAGEPAIRLDADHISICKLKSTNEQLYKGVVAMLSRILGPNAS